MPKSSSSRSRASPPGRFGIGLGLFAGTGSAKLSTEAPVRPASRRDKPPKPPLSDVEARLGHSFADQSLLTQALTHVGAVGSRVESNQRLEFLGDRVLGLEIAAMLCRAFPQADEGELSKRLANLVRRETCAEVATEWMVEPHIRLGAGDRASIKRTMLGDVCEAVIGAVYLDGGIEAAAVVIARAFTERMQAPLRPLRDPKTALQEWAQSRGHGIPIYRERNRSGPDHKPEFTVAVTVGELHEATGTGASKRLAEQAAANALMVREGNESMDA